ncbi:hypothetical protein F5X99DRAFT_379589 [Biscogniauxia marginata]|nr:hypothetical protein F5X99DRAFT_379589 [Biscogniauxia marginata]
MRISMLPPSLVLSLLLQTAPTIVRALENDFSAYPSGSQQCLYDSADQTSCTGNTGAELNQCLCRNKGNFIYNTATCVAKKSPLDLVAVYETLEYNCNGTGVTIAVSKDAFLAQASAVTSSSTPTATSTATPSVTPSTTTTATTAPTNSDAATSPMLSTGAKIGIGVGIGFGTVALGLAGCFVWVYARRRRSAPPAGATAIPPGSSAGPSWSPNTEYSNSYGMAVTPPAVEYTHMNTQQAGAVELPPDHEWKYPVGYPIAARKTHSNSNEPLLAELGEGAGQVAPVELPGSMPEDDGQQQHQHQYQHQQQQQGQQGQQQGQYEQQRSDNNHHRRNSTWHSDQSMGFGPGGDGQRSVSPVDVLSPTMYSHVAGSDVSPYSTYSSHY